MAVVLFKLHFAFTCRYVSYIIHLYTIGIPKPIALIGITPAKDSSIADFYCIIGCRDISTYGRWLHDDPSSAANTGK